MYTEKGHHWLSRALPPNTAPHPTGGDASSAARLPSIASPPPPAGVPAPPLLPRPTPQPRGAGGGGGSSSPRSFGASRAGTGQVSLAAERAARRAERPGLRFSGRRGGAVGRTLRAPRRRRRPSSAPGLPAPRPAGTLPSRLLAALCLAERLGAACGCQLPSEWRPLSEGCGAELAETISYAKVLALHQEAWGSVLEVPAGSRVHLRGLGYFSCHSHTVVQDYACFFFLRAVAEWWQQ
ncbi:hypothetical protein J1605_005061 [Eschrichtius robustus]|uniref:Uncharacterized protein n=1 Tax=Eschrichtius robustus TaxID=9764 RepID=A0AB34HD00_ESCRO|nr:hypothetical protein J1605_005061 [Eschrichtius robustus]